MEEHPFSSFSYVADKPASIPVSIPSCRDLRKLHLRIEKHKKNEERATKLKNEYLTLLNVIIGKNSKYQTTISASWNFDAGNNKRIIGIREVYEKIGEDGRIEEIINTPANASCQCKIIKWHQKNNEVQTFYLKNTILDSTKNPQLYQLIDDKSILLKDPETGVVIH